MNNRRGLGIVELIVAAGLMTVVIGACWFFFGAASRHNASTAQHTDELQARLVVIEHLTMDAGAASGLEVVSPRELRVTGPEAARSVTYEFDPESAELRRDGLPLPTAQAIDVAFGRPNDGAVSVTIAARNQSDSRNQVLELRAAAGPASGILESWQSSLAQRASELP